MDLGDYGPFASVIAVSAALVASFSLIALKAYGQAKKWTWLIEDAPPFMVTAGARAAAVAVIAAVFVTISISNYKWFMVLALFFGTITFVFISKFDRLRRSHICQIPIIAPDGTQAIDRRGNPLSKAVAIGSIDDMMPAAKSEFEKMPGISICKFMSGFGVNEVNNPASIWDLRVLAEISNKMTMFLMGIFLSAVLTLYISASVVSVNQV